MLKMIHPAVMLYAAGALYLLCSAAILFKKERFGAFLFAGGFILHTAYQVSRCFISGTFVLNGFTDSVFLLPWALACMVILMTRIAGDKTRWLAAVPLVILFTAFAIIYPKGIIPPTPNKTSVWTYAFFLTETFGLACFYLGAWAAAMLLAKKAAPDSYHRIIVWGFVLYTIAQIVGAVWAYMGWTTTFRWGARHLQSAVLWCYYAAYLHLRFMGWSDRKKALFAAAGFAVTALCTFGSYMNEMRFPRLGG